MEGYEELGFPSPEAQQFCRIVNVEVWRGRCPCRCHHCPVGVTPPAQRRRRFGVQGMDLGLLEKIAREVGRHPGSTLRLHSVGDLILWPQLARALALVRRHGARSWIFTSAVTRRAEPLEALARLGDIVEVSLNSITAADYHRTKGIDCFELVQDNLRRLHRARHDGLRLIVSRVQSPDEEADRAFVEHWKRSGLVDDAFVRSFHSYNDIILDAAGRPATTKLATEPCLVHWARFNIAVDGRAVVCFNELFHRQLDPRLVLGDVNTAEIVEIWRGPLLAAIRRASLAGNLERLPGGEAFPCTSCRYCQPLRGTRQTSEHQVDELLSAGS